MTSSRLFSGMPLKHFDKNEEVKSVKKENKSERDKRERKKKILDKNGNEIIVTPFKKWKAVSWAIVQFLWLLKIAREYRTKKKDNEEKPLSATIEIMSQAIRVWMIDTFNSIIISTDKLDDDLLNAKLDFKSKNKKLDISFRKLSVRIDGVVNLLIKNTIDIPELMVKFIRKIFREGGFIPSAYWLRYEKEKIELDKHETLVNFNQQR